MELYLIEELGRRIGCVFTERIGHKRHMVLVVIRSSDSPVQHVGNLNTACHERHSRPSFRGRGGRDENLGSCRNKFFLCPLLSTIQCHVARSAPNPGVLLLLPQYSCIHHRSLCSNAYASSLRSPGFSARSYSTERVTQYILIS
jgi:hypothetical protein